MNGFLKGTLPKTDILVTLTQRVQYQDIFGILMNTYFTVNLSANANFFQHTILL